MTTEPPALDPPAVATAPVCAVHESAPATGTCERCGNYTCPLCLDPESRLAYCEACRQRTGMGQIAWERTEGSWLSRWWETCRAVIVRPTETFASVWPGPVSRAFGFAAVTGALIGSVIAALGVCAAGALYALGFLQDLGDMGSLGPTFLAVVFVVVLLYPVIIPAAVLFSVSLRGLCFHGAAAILGGTGAMTESLWVMAYLHAIQLTMLPLMFLQQIPIIGPLIGLAGYLAIEVFYALHLTNAAKRYHHLEGGRAALAGWFPFLIILLLATSCCVLGMVMAFAAR